MKRRADLSIVYPNPVQLMSVAEACHELHKMEGGDETAIGSSVTRCFRHLEHLHATGKGIAFVACIRRQFIGCIVLELDPMRKSMAVASGLWVCAGAPRKTALLLMQAAALFAASRGVKIIFARVGIEKNQRRTTYRRMGFRDTEMTNGGARVYSARLVDIEQALGERLKNGINR